MTLVPARVLRTLSFRRGSTVLSKKSAHKTQPSCSEISWFEVFSETAVDMKLSVLALLALLCVQLVTANPIQPSGSTDKKLKQGIGNRRPRQPSGSTSWKLKPNIEYRHPWKPSGSTSKTLKRRQGDEPDVALDGLAEYQRRSNYIKYPRKPSGSTNNMIKRRQGDEPDVALEGFFAFRNNWQTGTKNTKYPRKPSGSTSKTLKQNSGRRQGDEPDVALQGSPEFGNEWQARRIDIDGPSEPNEGPDDDDFPTNQGVSDPWGGTKKKGKGRLGTKRDPYPWKKRPSYQTSIMPRYNAVFDWSRYYENRGIPHPDGLEHPRKSKGKTYERVYLPGENSEQYYNREYYQPSGGFYPSGNPWEKPTDDFYPSGNPWGDDSRSGGGYRRP